MENSLKLASCLLFVMSSLGSAQADDPDKGRAFFESKILPVLKDSCFECHSTESGKNKGGLTLDTKVGLRQGGNSGPGVAPHNLEESMVWLAVSWQDFKHANATANENTIPNSCLRWNRPTSAEMSGMNPFSPI